MTLNILGHVLIPLMLGLLLVWQLWRSRLPWSWRWLWLPATVGLWWCWQPLQVLREQRELQVLTAGDEHTPAAADAWLEQRGATRFPFQEPADAVTVQQLRQHLAEHGGQRLQLFGYGFPESVWQQLPAATVIWHAPARPVWQLTMPSAIQLGDELPISVQAPAVEHSLQLLDQRGEVLVEAEFSTQTHAGSDTALAQLRWRPAASGRYDWLLRVRRADGAVSRDIPIAFVVQPVAQLQFRGEFAAPSFEQRALRDWLAQTGMRGEFVTRTGQTAQRRDRFGADAETAAPAPTVLLRDLRSWLQSSAAERQRVLTETRQGRTLLLLSDGSEQTDAARTTLRRQLAIDWLALSESEQRFTLAGVTLHRSAWLPQPTTDWRRSELNPAVLYREWQQGRIIWLGVSDSHRLWQRARNDYAAWWQQALALRAVTRAQWQPPLDTAVVGQPAPLCIENLQQTAPAAASRLTVLTPTGVQQSLPLQPSGWPGRYCALYTPLAPGWFTISAPVTASWRVFASPPLPEQRWLAAYQASLQHSQQYDLQDHPQQEPPLAHVSRALPRWPFFLVAIAALAGIWWRERQGGGTERGDLGGR